ncbi:hypothetical protein AWH69_00880 [Janibacter melonis]|uniref:Uncharacterized protein n=1 Tax=Janibacter melonis TaxID=262209 RepID=A0A176QFC9_9MICO|nr:hypothetical protein [Janibacter melonis]OAB88400.1 hypothetical protein AWH69_00880 [Janibacter melonis]
MIGRVLRERAGQAALVGALGTLVLLVGAVLGSWQVASVGAALALLCLLGLAAWAVVLLGRPAAPVPRPVSPVDTTSQQPGVATGTSAPSDATAVVSELSTGRVLEDALRRSGLTASLSGAVAEHLARAPREQADLVRLVTRHDLSPAAPLGDDMTPSAVLAAVTAVVGRRPRRVLVLGSGNAVLWLAGAAREAGAHLDVVCDEAVVTDLDEQLSVRGLRDVVDVLVEDSTGTEVDRAARWADPRTSTHRYDLVLVLPLSSGQARSAVDSLDLLLERLEDDGAIFVGGAPGTSLLGQAWAARPELRATATGAAVPPTPQVHPGHDGPPVLLVRSGLPVPAAGEATAS